MPVYEYICLDCKKKSQFLIGMVAGVEEEKCTYCHSFNLRRLVSRFSRLRTEDERIDEITDKIEDLEGVEDLGEMQQFAKEMGKAMDMDVSEEMEQMFEEDLSFSSEDVNTI